MDYISNKIEIIDQTYYCNFKTKNNKELKLECQIIIEFKYDNTEKARGIFIITNVTLKSCKVCNTWKKIPKTTELFTEIEAFLNSRDIINQLDNDILYNSRY